MDGIQRIDKDKVLFSDFNGHLYLLENNGSWHEILNTASTQVNLADFEWIPEENMLVIPGLYSNRLRAYRFKSTTASAFPRGSGQNQ